MRYRFDLTMAVDADSVDQAVVLIGQKLRIEVEKMRRGGAVWSLSLIDQRREVASAPGNPP